MAERSRARRKTTFAAIFMSTWVMTAWVMSAWVHAESLPPQVYSTAIGEIRRVVIDQWMAVRMNTGTGASVTSNPERCEISLDHGEALFEVKGESPRPLRIVGSDTVVSTSVGTFSVRVRDAKNVDVIVKSGQVTVGTTLVRERRYARVSPDGIHLRELNDVEVSRRLEWTTGHLMFAGETLSEATAEFNRYNARKLVIADRTIGSIPIGGKFLTSDVQSFIAALRPLGIRRLNADASDDGDDVIRLVGPFGASAEGAN